LGQGDLRGRQALLGSFFTDGQRRIIVASAIGGTRKKMRPVWDWPGPASRTVVQHGSRYYFRLADRPLRTPALARTTSIMDRSSLCRNSNYALGLHLAALPKLC
jgi:hypothetical protein